MMGLLLAVAAGFWAASASVFAKLAMAYEATDLSDTLCEHARNHSDSFLSELSFSFIPSDLIEGVDCLRVVSMSVSVACFSMIFLCNAVMWTLFVKAMQLCSSTVEATITNTAANLLFTAAFGHTLFDEVLPVLWWVGMSLIIMGMCLITHGSESAESIDSGAAGDAKKKT